MNKKDLSNLGREFKDILKNSIYTGDFHKINQDVGKTVNSALDMAFEEVRRAMSSIQVEHQPFKSKPTAPTPNKQPTVKQQPTKTQVSFPHAPVGKVGGILLTVFGSIGIGGLGIAVIVLAILGSLSSGAVTLSPLISGLLVFLGVSVLMEMKGSTILKRVKRFQRYLSLLYGRTSCSIKEIAAYSGFSERFIIKDFRKMIALGMFPQAHIVEKKSLIMLNRESYEQYIAQASQNKEKTAPVHTKSEVNSVIEEGRMYILKINEAKKAIPDVDVANKIHRMEDIISKIIGYVENHLEKLPEVRRFMEYYLPTTIKLLNAYREFDRQTIQGENITTAKSEIKSALDTINLAFENLLDGLFENAAWDVSTDISVLQTMFAQEGLTEKDFNKK